MKKSTTAPAKGMATVKAIVLTLAGIGLASLPISGTYANPQDGQVVAGSAAIRQETPNKIGITQTTDKAIIDWRSYSIGANEHVQYYQPSAASVTLNRVVGADPSQILGRLTANGQVFLVNPNGIFFGKNAQIDVAGLVASTHNIRNEDFLAGRYLFNIPGNPGAAVINEGDIRIADTGIAAFVAPSVANRGVIVAKLGKVALASANGYTLDFTGDELLTFLVSDEVAQTAFDLEGNQLTSFVENAGHIEAQGGYVLLTAKAAENAIHGVINQSGSIEATSVGQQHGEIVLAGGLHGVVSNAGTLDASGKDAAETGGTVQITGEKIGLLAGARIDVSGYQGGGKVIVGGDYLGGKASAAQQAETGITLEAHTIPTAHNVRVEAGASIDASATVFGEGGKVIVWADDRLDFDGQISSRGGQEGGNGGRVETSGKQQLFVSGTVDAGADKGQGGLWFMDPLDAVIGISGNAGVTHSRAAISSSLNLGTTVTVQSDSGARPGSITLLDSIIKTAGGTSTLNLFSDGAVIINRGGRIASSSGALNVNINARYNVANPGYGLVAIGNDSSYAIETNGGQVDITGLIQTYQGKAIKTSGGQVLARTTPTSSNSDARGFIGIGPVPANATSAYTIDAGNGSVIMRATDGTITLDDHAMTANSVSLNGNVYARPNILAFNMADEATRSVIESGFGGSSGYGTSFPGNDDNSTSVNIASLSGTGLTLLGQNFGDFIYLSNNGYMRFDVGDGSYTPYSLSNTSNPIVSAYFGDVDTRGTGNVYYATHATSNDNKAVLTWIGTGYYSYGTDKTNTFQLQVENLGVESNVRLSYQQLQWTTGSASGGSGGLGGTVARAGIVIPGTNETLRFELPSSGRETDMLALASLPGNTGKVGVWSFRLWPEATPPNYRNGRYEVAANTLTVNGSSSGHQLEKGIPGSSNVENADRRRTEDYLSQLLVNRFAYLGPQEFVLASPSNLIVFDDGTVVIENTHKNQPAQEDSGATRDDSQEPGVPNAVPVVPLPNTWKNLSQERISNIVEGGETFIELGGNGNLASKAFELRLSLETVNDRVNEMVAQIPSDLKIGDGPSLKEYLESRIKLQLLQDSWNQSLVDIDAVHTKLSGTEQFKLENVTKQSFQLSQDALKDYEGKPVGVFEKFSDWANLPELGDSFKVSGLMLWDVAKATPALAKLEARVLLKPAMAGYDTYKQLKNRFGTSADAYAAMTIYPKIPNAAADTVKLGESVYSFMTKANSSDKQESFANMLKSIESLGGFVKEASRQDKGGLLKTAGVGGEVLTSVKTFTEITDLLKALDGIKKIPPHLLDEKTAETLTNSLMLQIASKGTDLLVSSGKIVGVFNSSVSKWVDIGADFKDVANTFISNRQLENRLSNDANNFKGKADDLNRASLNRTIGMRQYAEELGAIR